VEPTPTTTQTVKAVPDNLGSSFLICNLLDPTIRNMERKKIGVDPNFIAIAQLNLNSTYK
jgi:hypothetical protein